MEPKDYLMYFLSVPAVIWTIYEATRIPGYVSTLQVTNPDCYKPNPYRTEIFVGTQIILACISTPL